MQKLFHQVRNYKVARIDENWSGITPNPSSSKAPWKIYNIGNNKPVELLYYIECIEKALGMTAKKEMLPLQPGDVEHTFADTTLLSTDLGYKPKTSIESGVKNFITWYKNYYL